MFQKVFILMLVSSWSVWSTQMQWGDNPDLVDLENVQQGREHIKRMVVLVGETVDLKCQVLFTQQPVSEIIWKNDGELIRKPDNQIVKTTDGDGFLHIEDHRKIDIITEDMHGSTVYCEYSKGQNGSGDWAGYSGRVEAVLSVFTLEILASEEVCDSCQGKVKLVFKETSHSEANVDKRIKSKIAQLTNLNSEEIFVDKSEYSVTLPLAAVNTNPAIWDIRKRNVNTWSCKCRSATLSDKQLPLNFNIWIIVVIGISLLSVLGSLLCIIWLYKYKKTSRKTKAENTETNTEKGLLEPTNAEKDENEGKSLLYPILNQKSGFSTSQEDALIGY